MLEFYDGPRTTFYLDPPYVGVEEEYYEAHRGVGGPSEAVIGGESR